MKHLIIIILSVVFSSSVLGQQLNSIRKSWIKVLSDDLSARATTYDTIYTRYTFDRDVVNISLEPAWDDHVLNWEPNGVGIRIGFQDYLVKELTDTSLILEAPAFRRIRFLSEDYMVGKAELPIQVDSLNGRPVYLADQLITARYKKGRSLSKELEPLSHGYNIRKISRLRIAFVVDEKGAIQKTTVLEGISEGFDSAMARGISNTSKKWRPAFYNGKPVQTLMIFERRFLNSSSVGRTISN